MSNSKQTSGLFINREELNELTRWLGSAHRKPMVLRGARQVGKSELIRRLASQQGLRLAEVNFELQPALDKIFSAGEPQLIISRLQQSCNMVLNEKTLLFLDEVQLSQSAFASLRMFYEKHPQIPVVAAGSLLEFALAEFQTAMPVGRVTFRWISPLSFNEYLSAKNEDIVLDAISQFVDGKSSKVSPEAHERLLMELARYVYIGGMPEAMRRSLEESSWEEAAAAAAEVHSDILLSYRNDFYKYRGRLPVDSLHAVLDAMPRVSALNKVKYTSISREFRAESLKNAIFALGRAGVLRQVMATQANGIPLSAGKKEDYFKILPLDIGLLVSQSFGGAHVARPCTDLFQKWTQGSVFEQSWLGQIAEILVGQSMRHSMEVDQPLYFWMRESKGAEAEVDYVLQLGTRVIPIEVKAGASGTLRSLHSMVAEKGLDFAVRFDLNPPSLQHIDMEVPVTGGKMRRSKYRLLNLPLYLADWLPNILASFTEGHRRMSSNHRA
jgi:predicted AAA+ superfamily ATPase